MLVFQDPIVLFLHLAEKAYTGWRSDPKQEQAGMLQLNLFPQNYCRCTNVAFISTQKNSEIIKIV